MHERAAAQRVTSVLVELSVLAFALLGLVWGGIRGMSISFDQAIPGLPVTVGQMYLALPIAGVLIALSPSRTSCAPRAATTCSPVTTPPRGRVGRRGPRRPGPPSRASRSGSRSPGPPPAWSSSRVSLRHDLTMPGPREGGDGLRGGGAAPRGGGEQPRGGGVGPRGVGEEHEEVRRSRRGRAVRPAAGQTRKIGIAPG